MNLNYDRAHKDKLNIAHSGRLLHDLDDQWMKGKTLISLDIVMRSMPRYGECICESLLYISC